MIKKPLAILALVGLTVALAGCTLAVPSAISYGPPNLLLGIWHGLLAPYILLFRFFIDNPIYANPDGGFLYDAGFLIGILFSLPIGWVAFLITILLPFFSFTP